MSPNRSEVALAVEEAMAPTPGLGSVRINYPVQSGAKTCRPITYETFT